MQQARQPRPRRSRRSETGEIHILLGTQMIAKGLDFPNVTLVGVVNADVALHIPDFRSAERTFQLLSQVAGRAGRGPAGGRVLVQTFTPDHPCILHAATHDYAGFVAGEMRHRAGAQLPAVPAAGADHRPRPRAAGRAGLRRRDGRGVPAGARRRWQADGPAEVRLLGPAEAPVFRLKGYYRYHFQLQSPSPATLHKLLRAVLPTLHPPAGVEFALDVDPFSML